MKLYGREKIDFLKLFGVGLMLVIFWEQGWNIVEYHLLFSIDHQLFSILVLKKKNVADILQKLMLS